MEFTSTTIILVAVICLILGFFASLLLNTLRDDIQPNQESVISPPGGRPGKYVPIARLWRDQKSGVLLVEKDDRTFITPSPLNDTQRNELEQAARDMRTWLGMGLSGLPVYTSRPQVELTPKDNQNLTVKIESVPKIEQNLVDKNSPLNTNVTSTAPSTDNTEQNKVNPAGKVAPVLSEKSIVMQIEDILQDMISGGSFEHHGIHLNEDPIRGVIVSVGSSRYEGIDAVPDPEVKALIRSAVKAWEDR